MAKYHNQRFVIDEENLQRLAVHARRFAYKPSAGFGWKLRNTWGTCLEGEYYYQARVKIKDIGAQGETVIIERNVTRGMTFLIDGRNENLRCIGRKDGRQAFFDALKAVGHLRYARELWRLDLGKLVAGLRARFNFGGSELSLLGGILPKTIYDRGLMGKGEVVFGHAENGEEIFERYRKNWLAVDLRPRLPSNSRIRIYADGSMTITGMEDGDEGAALWAHDITPYLKSAREVEYA